MNKTYLPSKSDYDRAIEELQKLNDDLFYSDFRETIDKLSINVESIALSNLKDFKEESGNLVSRANFLLTQIDALQIEIGKELKDHQQSMAEKNRDLLETERKHLLYVYNELHEKMNLFTSENDKLQKEFKIYSKQLLDNAIGNISPVSNRIKEFTENLTLNNKKNIKILEQNQEYLRLAKEQILEFEKRITNHILSMHHIEESIKTALVLFEEQINKQVIRIENDLSIQEEKLINRVSEQYNNLIIRQAENNKVQIQEAQKRQEEVEVLLNNQSQNIHEQLTFLSSTVVNKEELLKSEKRFSQKIYLLVSTIIIQTILSILIAFLA